MIARDPIPVFIDAAFIIGWCFSPWIERLVFQSWEGEVAVKAWRSVRWRGVEPRAVGRDSVFGCIYLN